MLFANCHFHSTFSDDEYTPEELVLRGVAAGFRAMVLTDHDTVRGSYFFARAARAAGVLTLMGCEFTAKHPERGFHIVGVDFNPENKEVREILRRGAAKQTERTHMLFDYGMEHGTIREGATWQEVLDANPDNDYICNNQVFRLMLAKGIYQKEEYDEFLMSNFSYALPQSKAMAPMLREKYTNTVGEVLHAIRAAGGVPIIAHPEGQEKYADELVALGALGFETSHPELSDACKSFFSAYCDKHNLYQLGGTDHSSVLGGTGYQADMPPESGNVTEEHFMQLYRRERG